MVTTFSNDADNSIVFPIKRAQVSNDFEKTIRLINARAETILKKKVSLDGIAIAVAGRVSEDGSRVMSSGSMRDWHDREVIERLNKEWGCRVDLRNDAEAAAVAEATDGAAMASRSLVVWWDIGIGAARAYSKQGDVTVLPTEFGHSVINMSAEWSGCGCGQAGCLESLASGRVIGHKVDALPSESREKIAKAMATALGNVNAYERLDRVVFGGYVARDNPGLIRQVNLSLNSSREMPNSPIVSHTRYGEEGVLYGALKMLLRNE